MNESGLLTIVKGYDIRFLVQLVSDGVPLNLSSVEEATCYVVDDTSRQFLFEATVIISDPANGEIEIVMRRDQTAKLIPSQVVAFDIRLRFASGDEVVFPSPPVYGVVLSSATKPE